jgi:hypothetical protein
MAMSKIDAWPTLRADTYVRHALHSQDCLWPEKNCYTDVWIELVHTLGCDPMAMFSFTHTADFEGDQWTFFKPVHSELRELYGIDVQELTVWRPLLAHAQEYLSAGKFICCEVDAFYLPDTAGTDYRRQHSKTTVLMASLDLAAGQLGYFHNAGYFELSGDDFTQLFRLTAAHEAALDAAYLPPYAEFVRVDRLLRQSPPELAERSFRMLQRHFKNRPRSNPFSRFGQRFRQDRDALQSCGLAHYHAWAFASIRQAGAAFELAAAHLRWLNDVSQPDLLEAADSFDSISAANKTLILKGARAVHAGRTLEAAELVASMELAWDTGMSSLQQALSTVPALA